MEQEMEMTRDELNKMTKRDLIVHLKQHGKRPNRQSMLKGHIIDLIIDEGFNRPPPKREESKTLESSEEIKVRPKHWEIITRVTTFSSQGIMGCKTSADLHALIKTTRETVQYLGDDKGKDDSEGELNQLD